MPNQWFSLLFILQILLGLHVSPATTFSSRSDGPVPRLPFGTTPLDSSQVAQVLAQKSYLNHDTHSIDTIRNKVALYTFAIDGKQFDVLDHVFASDVVANYSEPLGVLSPLTNITATLEVSQAKVSTSQHLIGSQFVMLMDEHNAFSVSYYRSAQFGFGEYLNEAVYSFGQYQDSWFRHDPETQDWLIQYRNLVYMAPFVGNLSLFN